jgi:hypothetical protein
VRGSSECINPPTSSISLIYHDSPKSTNPDASRRFYAAMSRETARPNLPWGIYAACGSFPYTALRYPPSTSAPGRRGEFFAPLRMTRQAGQCRSWCHSGRSEESFLLDTQKRAAAGDNPQRRLRLRCLGTRYRRPYIVACSLSLT